MANGGVEYAAGLVAAQHFDRAELAAHGADFFGLVVFAAFFKHLRVKGCLVHGFPRGFARVFPRVRFCRLAALRLLPDL